MSVNTNKPDLTTIRGAFSFLNSLGRDDDVRLPGPGERNAAGDAVERITGEPVSVWVEQWGGRRRWDAAHLLTALSDHLHRHLVHRLASRRWPLRLMVNGEPVGYGLGVNPVVVIYDPTENGGLERFISAAAVACTNSRQRPTILLVRHAESCPADVLEYMLALISTGFGTTWPNGLRVEFDPNHFGLDLELDPTNDAAWRLVDYILEYQKTNSQ